VTGITQRFDNAAGKILIREKSHLCGEGIGTEFVREVTGVGETGEEIFARQTRVAGEQVALGLSCGEKFEDQLDREPRPAHHRFADQHVRIDFDTIPPIHIVRIARSAARI
jgi:hypothetical protein